MSTIIAEPATEQQRAAAALWTRYARQRDAATRAALIEQYAPLVKYVAGRLRLSLPPSLDRDDVLGYGTVGLIEAIDRFDPTRGVKFETYAIMRVRGAIIDAIRAMDLVPHGVRQRVRQIEAAYRELFAEHGAIPSDEQVAGRLGWSVDDVRRATRDAACVVVPLNDRDDDDERDGAVNLADPDSPDPVETFERGDLARALAGALDKLAERDRLIVTLYYYEELTLLEIGQVLGVSESRVSQLLTRVRVQLRALLQDAR